MFAIVDKKYINDSSCKTIWDRQEKDKRYASCIFRM